ncbi:MAG: helix-turn-helix domain-containing protein [Oscillospiraceae bacterium]|nr:helix-turn-helix domain-containing protein [Oscillospiraceae bacterium]
MNQKVFSDGLKRLRAEKGYTTEQIVAMLGVSPACVYRWEYKNTLSDSMFNEFLNKNF